jgi:hypothetical protein
VLPTERCGPQHVASFFGTSSVWVFDCHVVAGWPSWADDLLARFVLGCSASYVYVVVVPPYIG